MARLAHQAPPCIAPIPRANARTLCVPAVGSDAEPSELFAGCYARFAAPCREIDEPGVVAIAIDGLTGALVGMVGMRACFGRPAVAVLGRHHRSDLVLWGDDIALRHAAIVLDPVTSWAEGARASYRVLDLRTTAGLVDEIGRPLQAFRADGPAVIRCGRQVVFVLPLGDPTDWPASAAEAWAMLPQRVYLDECGGIARSSARTSMIFRTPAVRETSAPTTGALEGTLEIEQPNHRFVVAIGRDALRDGVLLGRYRRCDLLGELDPSISRVHGLLLQVGARTIVADLASTHGLGPAGGERTRIAELVDGSELWLACETRVRWRAAGDRCRSASHTGGPIQPRRHGC